MGDWLQVQGGGGGLLLGAPPRGTPGATLSSATRRKAVIFTSRHLHHLRHGGPTPPPGRPPQAINGSSPKKNQRKQQQQQQPSVLEVQRAIGVAGGDDGGENARADGGSGPASVLDFFASTPVGQAESPAEKKLREAAEWVVERTESRGLFGQRILMVVCLNILPVWVFLLLVASGIIKLPFSLPFMDDLLS